MKNQWIRQLGELLRGDPPPLATVEPDAQQEFASRVVDLSARVGQVAVGAGMSAADTISLIRRVSRTYQVRAHADVNYTAVLVSCSVANGRNQVTRLRTVSMIYGDYSILSAVENLVEEIASGTLTVEEALTRIRRIDEQRSSYRPWFLGTASAAMGVSMCLFLGGNLLESTLAGLSTLLVSMLTTFLWKKSVPYFFVHVLSAAVPTVTALIMMTLRANGVSDLWFASPSLVVASGIVTMLAGMSVVSAAQDALDGWFVTASARILDLVMRTGGLVTGVVVTLWLGFRLGVPGNLAPAIVTTPPLPLMLASSFVFAAAYAITVSVGPRAALLCGVLGTVAWIAYALSLPLVEVHPMAAAIAAFVVGLIARPASRLGKVPLVALVTAGIAPLVPGLMLYRGLYGFVASGKVVAAGNDPATLIAMAAFTGIGLAVGSSAGTSLGRVFLKPVLFTPHHVNLDTVGQEAQATQPPEPPARPEQKP